MPDGPPHGPRSSAPRAERARAAVEAARASRRRRLGEPGSPRRRTEPTPGARRPRRRPEITQRERGMAIAAVAVLLLCGLIALIAIASSGDDDEFSGSPAPEATPTRAPERDSTATPSATPTPAPTLSPQEAEARRAALATVRAQGYRAVDRDQWQPRNQLRVLVGRAMPASGVRGEKAFFFLGNDYLGTDTKDASHKVTVGRQRDVTITLSYTTFGPTDNPCCPTGDKVTVRFRWDGARLVPLDPIPALQQRGARAG